MSGMRACVEARLFRLLVRCDVKLGVEREKKVWLTSKMLEPIANVTLKMGHGIIRKIF